jgi:hypothetical protein
MALPKRNYYRIAAAAEILGCTVEDLVHWAVQRETKLGVLFEADWMDPPWLMGEVGMPPTQERVGDYAGFAYIDGSYLLEAERSGRFSFNALELLDGRVALIAPGQCDDGRIRATLVDLFIHEREFALLRNEPVSDRKRGSQANDSEPSAKGRNTALCIIGALAHMSGMDLTKPYKDAAVISSQLAEMKVNLGSEAIATWLKDVREAMSTRSP